jgi:hypothetical protein
MEYYLVFWRVCVYFNQQVKKEFVMSMIKFAEKELHNLGWLDSEDQMSVMMAQNILELLKVMAKQGHSGFSAGYLLSMFGKLANYKPLTPLTGEDWEWQDVGDGQLQNTRCGTVFKNSDGETYDIDGKAFWDWCMDSEGVQYKSYYTCKDSTVPVVFPYTVPDKPVYEYRQPPLDSSYPSQTEAGIN